MSLSGKSGQSSFDLGSRSYDLRTSGGQNIYDAALITVSGGVSSGAGRAYARLAGGSSGVLATMQQGAFNMTAVHSYQPGNRFGTSANIFTFTFASPITNPVPIVTPTSIPATQYIDNNLGTGYIGSFSMTCTETECIVYVRTGPTPSRMAGCTCLIL